MKQAIEITVTGIVQKVGFRKFSKTQAEQLHIVGSAQNQLDGSVKIFAYGEKENIEKFISILKVGPSRSKVESVDFHIIDGFLSDSFEIIK
ncbi:acylphosphatase [Helicobacter cappadocius]|uniref:acylphosphatase n=1 Tax=Helicobacter cappadocius TaxID=3063998 RepID=A0AA90PIF4_9HELI|nr:MULTISPECIES: acylphosphatase [unclassified Helicobacter]MDO7252544.1 acylphosphatase [Helicobacter sp. faydin-H75]MDP2538411.1 acylphosphatase [Helicobacter sp. faydin-H76]